MAAFLEWTSGQVPGWSVFGWGLERVAALAHHVEAIEIGPDLGQTPFA